MAAAARTPAGWLLGRAFLGCLLALCGASASCAPRTGQAAEGVLIISIDGLRADHMASFGYDRTTTPTLDELAQEGVLFTQTLAAAPRLVPAHMAILAGIEPLLAERLHPLNEPAEERRWRLPQVFSTGSVEYLASGWRTAAFSDDRLLAPHFGFARGFQSFEFSDLDAAPAVGGSGAGGLVPKLQRWVSSLDRDENWFAYLHLSDLLRSWSYSDAQWDTYFELRKEDTRVPPVGSVEPVFFAVPPTRWSGGSDSLGVYEARYDGTLRRLDEDLRRLFDALRLIGRWENTTLCVVGSHGLQLGEAGLIIDSGRLTVADLGVPWILRPAASHDIAPGRRIDALASTTDVLPTLLELTGLRRGQSMTGVSQRPLLVGDGPAPRTIAFASCGLQYGFAAFEESYVYERTFPGVALNRGLVESWYGDREEHLTDSYTLIYDRYENPYPDPFDSLPPTDELDGMSARREALVERGEAWFQDVVEARQIVQKPRISDEEKLAAVARLQSYDMAETSQ